MRHLAEENALIHPQQVTGAPDHACRAEDPIDRLRLEGSAQHQELADETIQQWQSRRGQHGKQKEGGVLGHGCRQAAKLGDLISVAAFVKDPRQHKEAAGGHAVRQHDEDCSVQAGHGETKNSEDNESKVADGRVGDQLFQIRLHERNQRAIDNADQCQNDNPRGIAARLGGEEADIEPQQAVGAHLQQHAGQQHRSGGGRLHVSVRQPGVKREERHLYREGNEEAEEQPKRGVFETGHAAATNRVLNYDKVETASLGVEP